ncbi:hypothetical protein F5X99DRAFT_373158 [Biscogniauxia marginata]|nr:hypothetical protein F5X99DRAFT_373158 [Biscogniauxia marginata]
MAPSSIDGQPTPLREFHLFPKLPIELQLMVWEFWRPDQPSIRHYFFLEALGRSYAAVDMQTNRAVLMDESPLDPMKYKICFTNKVATIADRDTITSIIKGSISKGMRASPSYTWVDFEKDVFFVHNTTYKLSGHLRFIYRQMGERSPHVIENNHWSIKIQQLALLVSVDTEDLADLDRYTFSHLSALKTVYLVCKPGGYFNPDFFVGNRLARYGFKDLDLVVNQRSANDQYYWAQYSWTTVAREVIAARSLRDKLREVFDRNGQGEVKIEIVCDRSLLIPEA